MATHTVSLALAHIMQECHKTLAKKIWELARFGSMQRLEDSEKIQRQCENTVCRMPVLWSLWYVIMYVHHMQCKHITGSCRKNTRRRITGRAY